MSYFLSGSGENKTSVPKLKGSKSIRFKEEVVSHLVTNFEIPQRVAEIAVIDLRLMVNQGYHGKLTSLKTAYTMVPKITALFKRTGQWEKSLV